MMACYAVNYFTVGFPIKLKSTMPEILPVDPFCSPGTPNGSCSNYCTQ